ncbi:MAG: dTDP-4-amino-4,6-dideoxygalactose transaminase [bacterium]|nr:dTDP-4-amino-4,6-dideoxygalactose transaminase [bacterium]
MLIAFILVHIRRIIINIPFNLPYLTGAEESYLLEALRSREHCGNREFAQKCIALLQERYGFGSVFLTPSCTAAMEMGAILADLQPGDEVIMPSYTFSSTANAIVLRGARPVFCDVAPDTMNIDVSRIEALITPRTKMIAPIDYAGIPCDMDAIQQIAGKHGLTVMQDAAQSLHSIYRGKPCGSQAPLAAFSFHESKNFSCGEGGALVVNDPALVERALILQEKGTDRALVLKGAKSKYSWVDLGSSYLLSDLLAAVLLAQLQQAEEITVQRSRITEAYYRLFTSYEQKGCLSLPHPSDDVTLNHHAYFVIFDRTESQQLFLSLCRQKSIYPYTGYLPLHSSVMGRKFGYQPEDLSLTEALASRIVRLPFYTDLQGEQLEYCLEGMQGVLGRIYPC